MGPTCQPEIKEMFDLGALRSRGLERARPRERGREEVSADSQVSGEALPTSIGQFVPLRWVCSGVRQCSEEYLVRQNS